jgi:hypothetical protein
VLAPGGVLLQVETDEAKAGGPPVGRLVGELAAPSERTIELGDLVALGQVRVAVALAVEGDDLGHLEAERRRQPQALLERGRVEDRQRAGVAQADGAAGGVRRRAERHRAAAEELRPRRHAQVDLEAHDRLRRAHPIPRGSSRW